MHAVTQAGEAWDYPQPLDNVTPTTYVVPGNWNDDSDAA
jgi:hypothetical protein